MQNTKLRKMLQTVKLPLTDKDREKINKEIAKESR